MANWSSGNPQIFFWIYWLGLLYNYYDPKKNREFSWGTPCRISVFNQIKDRNWLKVRVKQQTTRRFASDFTSWRRTNRCGKLSVFRQPCLYRCCNQWANHVTSPKTFRPRCWCYWYNWWGSIFTSVLRIKCFALSLTVGGNNRITVYLRSIGRGEGGPTAKVLRPLISLCGSYHTLNCTLTCLHHWAIWYRS